MLRKAIPLCGIVLVLGSLGIAQQSSRTRATDVATPILVPLGARVKLRWSGRTVYILEGQRRHEIPLDDEEVPVDFDTVKLQSAKQSDGSIYLLLDTSGPSIRPEPGAEPSPAACGGGGVESDIIWVKLDGDWDVKNTTSIRYESCLHAIDPLVPPKWKGSEFSLTFGNTEWHQTLSYSLKHPEAGLSLTQRVQDSK